MNQKKINKKIFIVRSAPVYQFQRVLDTLQRKYPEAEFSVLTHSASAFDLLHQHNLRLYTYRHEKINLFTVGWKLFSALRDADFDEGVIIYSNHLGQGYGAIRLLMFLIRPRSIFTYNVSLERNQLKPGRYMWVVMRRKIRNLIHAFIYLILYCRKKSKGFKRENRH